MRINNKKRFALAAVALTIAMPALSSVAPTGVKADPPASLQLSYSGVGSDTTQAVMDAMSGQYNGKSYARAIGDGGAVIESYDATPAGADPTDVCISTTFNGGVYTRPNGSGAGVKAMSAAYGHGDIVNAGTVTRWLGDNSIFKVPASSPAVDYVCGAAPYNKSAVGATATAIASSANISGQVAFARASSIQTSGMVGTTGVTYVPFARDAVSAGWAFKTISGGTAGAPVTTMTGKLIADVYNNGPQVVTSGGQPLLIVGCDLNALSGTRSFFGGVINNTPLKTKVALANATPTDANGICNSVFEENTLAPVSTRAAAIATANATTGLSVIVPVANGGTGSAVAYFNIQLIVPHSAAAFIAQENNNSPSTLLGSGTLDTDFGLASVSNSDVLGGAGTNLGSPYSASGSPLVYSPSSTFYASTTWGRLVYNVLPQAVMTTTAGASTDSQLRSLFYGANSGVCKSSAIITAFGFLNLSVAVNPNTETTTCGSIGEIKGWIPPSSTTLS